MFDPPLLVSDPSPLETSLIVQKNSKGRWTDDSGSDWTDFVSGGRAADSGRVEGWDVIDHDVAIIDTVDIGSDDGDE